MNLGIAVPTGPEIVAPLPMPTGALYRHPNPDGSRKNCGNCVFWGSKENRCALHAADLQVDSGEWCGFHIFGSPMEKTAPRGGMQTVTPDISGLRDVAAGAACAGCRFYRDQGDDSGFCFGVSQPDDRKPPITVELLGVCARYEGM